MQKILISIATGLCCDRENEREALLPKKTAKIPCLILLIWLSVVSGYAGVSGTITGKVFDVKNKEFLPGANVRIEGTFLGSSTDAEGRFEIQNVPPGHYTLKVTFIGFKSKRLPVQVRAFSTVHVEVPLTPTTLQIEQIIVTGSRQPETLASAAASVNVLSGDEIRRRNNFRIDEALVNVPGVTIIGENVNIRGGSGYNRLGGSRTLVLIDDVPILTSDLGEANWNILPVSEIQHIEVLKGAASSQYGSGALSGVINIITKLPSQHSTLSVRQSTGIYDSPSVPEWKWTDRTLYFNRTDASFSRSVGPVGFRLAVSHHQSTGDRENGSFNRWYVTGKTLWHLPDNSTLTLFSTYSYEDRELFLQWMEQNKALNVPPPDRGARFTLHGFVGYAVYHKLFSPTLAVRARLSYNQQLVGIPFNIINAFAPAIGLGGEIQANWKPHKNHSISLGVDYKRDNVQSEYYGKRSANGISPYIQEIWKISELLQLNAGLRWDTYTLVGDSVEMQLSPKIGASYQPIAGTVLHLSFGRGFRAATVVERFISAGSKDFRALPNPDLQPERSTLFDVGLRQQIGESAYTEVTAFSSTYKHLIEPTLRSDLTAQFQNNPAARIQGIETEFRLHLWHDRLALRASGTWMDAREIESGQPMIYRPRFIGYLSPSFSYGSFSFEADYRYVSRLERVAIFPLDERVPVKVLDVRWLYRWKKLLFQLAIRNALNYNYTVSERVLGEIRNFVFSVNGEI